MLQLDGNIIQFVISSGDFILQMVNIISFCCHHEQQQEKQQQFDPVPMAGGGLIFSRDSSGQGLPVPGNLKTEDFYLFAAIYPGLHLCYPQLFLNHIHAFEIRQQ